MHIKNFPKLTVIALVCTMLVFVLYASMLSSDYSSANFGADGGDLLSAILTDGIPHPSGYPAYLLAGKLIQLLPFESPYLKGSILSALFAAASVGILIFDLGFHLNTIKHSGKNLIISAMVGISLGISPLFFSQAVIVEVYSMTMFFFACMLLWIDLIFHNEIPLENQKALVLLSFILGIGFGTHLMLVLMVPMMLMSVIYNIKQPGMLKKVMVYFSLMIISAVLVYMILPIRARGNPPINWGNPQTISGFLWLVSGKAYQGLTFRISGSELIQRVQYAASLLINQFSIVGLILGLIGATTIGASRDRLKWVYFWTLVVYPIFSIGYSTNDSFVYMLPTFIIFSLMIGFGLKTLFDTYGHGKRIFLPAIVMLVFLGILFVRLPGVMLKIDSRSETNAKVSAENCLQSVPERAILITSEDSDTFPIWYYHFGLGDRPDIRVVVESLLQFSWYQDSIKHTYTDIKLPQIATGNFSVKIKEMNVDRNVCLTVFTKEEKEKFLCVCQ